MQICRTLFVVACLSVASLAAQTAKSFGDYVPCLFDLDQNVQPNTQRAPRRLVRQTLDEWAFLGYVDARRKPELASTLSNHAIQDFPAVMRQLQAAGVLHLPAGASVNTLSENLKSTALTLERVAPADVACSQSLLSWNEASDAFNRRVADTYLVYQVNVRNLNAQKEFLLHDVQIAVDDHEFVAGRDKIIARGVALQGQTSSRRNTVERILEAMATLGLAATGILPAPAFRQGVNIFASGLVPGFASIVPDRSDDQLTRLNDIAFSASQAYKIVVPKTGSVTFVTFLPFRIFAAGKSSKNWTQAQWANLSDASCVILSGVHVTSD